MRVERNAKQCPQCGGRKDVRAPLCLVCADDKQRRRVWTDADVARLLGTAREMCDVFRVHVDRCTEDERARWVATIDALDRRWDRA